MTLKGSLVVSTLALFAQCSWADAYKCKGPDGAVKYQERPCAEGTATVARVRIDPPALTFPASVESAESIKADRSKAQPPARFDPDAKMGIVMSDLPPRDQFQSMAAYCGCKLIIDSSIVGGNETIRYENTSWSSALADMAARHGAVATLENGVVTVKKR